jgi:hypothetical protein
MKPKYFKKKEYTQCFHECPKCHLIIRQQTMPNQRYIELKEYHCLIYNLSMKRNLIIIQGDLPLQESYVWKTAR